VGLAFGPAAFPPGAGVADLLRGAAVRGALLAGAFTPVPALAFAVALALGRGVASLVVRRVAGRFAVMLTSWLWGGNNRCRE